LFLDGHEYIKACPNLRKYLLSPADGFLCTVEMDDGSCIRNPRIYKNGVQFSGKIHEQQQCQSVTNYVEFIVKHDRLGSQSVLSSQARASQTDDMVPRIMGATLLKNPKDLRALFHLGLHAQGRSNFKLALKYYKKYLKFSTVRSERWFILFNVALCHLSLHRPLRALWSLTDCEKETPNRWEVVKFRGIIYAYCKDFNRAIEFLVNSFYQNVGDSTYKPWPRDDGSTYSLIGECYFNLGDYYKASVSFNRAFELTKNEYFKKIFDDRSKLMLKIAENQK